MPATVTLEIDGQPITVPTGTTLLNAAALAGAMVPTICYHEHCTANALCRLCVVEVEGARVLAPACVATAAEGMRVHTRNERVERSRRTILELLHSATDISEAPEIQLQLDDYHANRERFGNCEQREPEIIDDNPMFIRDYSKCILCWRCVQVCAADAQFTYAINFSGRGFETSISTFFEQSLTESSCVFCGQCVGVCPTGALKPKRQWLLEQGQAPADVLAATRGPGKKQRARK